jgi:hypothetical protein
VLRGAKELRVARKDPWGSDPPKGEAPRAVSFLVPPLW